jgi:uncharacterized protein involved in type VI secretion and phage assembly
MQSTEARTQVWRGRSTVRTLRAGTRLTVTGTPLQQLGEAAPFATLRVTSVGVNNLPRLPGTRWRSCLGRFPNCSRTSCAIRIPTSCVRHAECDRHRTRRER